MDRALEAAWDEAKAEHGSRGDAVSKPMEAARALCLRGGKRLRAALVVVGAQIGGGAEDWTPLLPVCSAVELLQAYFLIHDDWMDGDDVRRGGPSVHAALEESFPTPHLAACGAVLAGDYTLALALRALSRVELASERWPALLARFAELQLDAVVGQQLDVLGNGENLDEVYRLKTASYTVMGPLELGMIWALGTQQRVEPARRVGPTHAELEMFAVPVGIAFQLRDDLIGALADPRVSGKPRGSDLRAGKPSLLVNTALQLSDAEGARSIREVFGNASATDAEVARALRSIEASGAPSAVEARIDELSAQAKAALGAPGFDDAARTSLEGVRVALVERVS